MMAARASSGWPLYSLILTLSLWVAARAVLWEAPFERGLLPMGSEPTTTQTVQPRHAEPLPGTAPAYPAYPEEPVWLHQPLPLPLPARQVYPMPLPRAEQSSPLARGGLRHIDRIMAHAILLQAGYGSPPQQHPFTSGVGPVAPGVLAAPEALPESGARRRWSLDMWAMWREDTTTPFTSGRPSYGRSQAGAVLAWHLAPSSGHAPQAYARVTRALAGQREIEGALGLSVRPLRAVPVRLAAEARVSETDRGSEVRGAVFAVSEVPPVALPGGLTGEAYVQGGYVSGDYSTAFVDGQARITRDVARTQSFRLSAGAGVWGGAQDDARRLDVGPSAALGFDLGAARGRISADYRFRVAGDAEPASGPTVTLTAGF